MMRALVFLPLLFLGCQPPPPKVDTLETGKSAAAQRSEKDKAATSGELFETIARLDGALFDAFNAHNTDKLMSMFSDDLEFYHDTGGLANYRKTRSDFEELFAKTPDTRRELVRDSLRVYPIKDHGALETGQHRFYHKENGKDVSATFMFAHIWRKTGGSWKLSRVISYGH
jgi:ketosteroid isomerase-like protein